MKFDLYPAPAKPARATTCEICSHPTTQPWILRPNDGGEELRGHKECLEDVQRTSSPSVQARLAASDLIA